jgi:hypothetical protein
LLRSRQSRDKRRYIEQAAMPGITELEVDDRISRRRRLARIAVF